MKALLLTLLALSLTACVVYNDGTDTGIITPLGHTSTADEEDGETM